MSISKILGIDCCVLPREGTSGNQPTVEEPLELSCTMNDGRPGTCFPEENCEGLFFPTSTGDWTGCRNQAKFSHYGCCVSKAARPTDQSNNGSGTCTIG